MPEKEKSTKKHVLPVEAAPAPELNVTQAEAVDKGDTTMSLVAMILGLVSLTGPGFLFGVPAIILGMIALKRKQGERGFSITGIVTGIISTVVSLIVAVFVIFAIIWGINHPSEQQMQNQRHIPTRESIFEQSNT